MAIINSVFSESCELFKAVSQFYSPLVGSEISFLNSHIVYRERNQTSTFLLSSGASDAYYQS